MNTLNTFTKLGRVMSLGLLAFGLAAAEPAFAAPKNGTRVAQEKRHKKKNKRNKKKDVEKRDEATDAGVVVDQPIAEANGQELHKVQEGPADEPYRWDVSLLSDFTVNNSTTGESKTGSADYELRLKALRVFSGAFEVGAGLDYDETSVKTKESTDTSRNYTLSLLTKYNFGNLDEDKTVFFVGAGVGLGSGTAKAAGQSVKSKSTELQLGLGMHYFVDTNVALTGELGYDAGSTKVGDGDPAKTSTLHLMRLGFSLFF